MTLGIAPTKFQGFELIDGKYVYGVASGQNDAVQTVVAHAGGLQPSATQINPDAALVYVSTVASANDSVKLPSAVKGKRLMILNGTATNAAMFGYNATDKINGSAGTGAFTLTANKSAIFFCPSDGFWGAVGGS